MKVEVLRIEIYPIDLLSQINELKVEVHFQLKLPKEQWDGGNLIAVETIRIDTSEDFLKRLILATQDKAAKRFGFEDEGSSSEFQWGFRPPQDPSA